MSGIILCRSEYSRRPYYIEGVAVNVYSLEEICYFLYNDIYLIGADFFCPELYSFIENDIKEPELAKKLSFLSEQKAGLSELVATILRYVDFYSENEIRQLLVIIDRLDTQNGWERIKSKADNFLDNRRYSSAIKNYRDILSGRRDKTLDAGFYCKTWHNLGVCYGRLFLFSSAADCFLKALDEKYNEESEKAYYWALCMAKLAVGESDDIGDSDNEQMFVARRELETCMDNAAGNEAVMELKREGKLSEYHKAIDECIRLYKDDYRDFIK